MGWNKSQTLKKSEKWKLRRDYAFIICVKKKPEGEPISGPVLCDKGFELKNISQSIQF